MNKQSKKKKTSKEIASNRKAFHDYTVAERFEAGLILEGWEVKSLRDGRAQLKESYIIIKNQQAFLVGAHISPIKNACQYTEPDPTRSRQLLLHAKELTKLKKAKEAAGYTIVPLNLHWSKKYVKITIALAKGKKTHDKREADKKADWKKQQHRLLKPK